MSETQQDVFNEVIEELDYVFSENDRLRDDQVQTLLDVYRGRYEAAGKVAVPKEVGEYIVDHKRRNFTIDICFGHCFNTLAKYDRKDTHYSVYVWMNYHPNDFAEAWIHGWVPEEETK